MLTVTAKCLEIIGGSGMSLDSDGNLKTIVLRKKHDGCAPGPREDYRDRRRCTTSTGQRPKQQCKTPCHPPALSLSVQHITQVSFHGRTTVSATEVSVLQARRVCGTACHRTYNKTWTSRVSRINWKHFCLEISQPRCTVTAFLCHRNTLTYLHTHLQLNTKDMYGCRPKSVSAGLSCGLG